jgi:antitoxin (DNA-binding transcriptional repressor) of toxin-antitoxin stability system
MPSKEPTFIIPTISLRSREEIRKYTYRLLDEKPENLEPATVELLDASLLAPISIILALRDTLLDETAPEIERLGDGILLAAFLEWLSAAGGPAETALHILGDLIQDLNQNSCEAFAEKFRGLEDVLRRSPLTLIDENERSRLLGKDRPRLTSAKPQTPRSDEMDLVPEEESSHSIVRMSLADAEAHFGELVDRIANEGLVIEIQQNDRVVARLSPAEPNIVTDGIDYGWSHDDYVVSKLVDEFSRTTNAHY